jgi:multiple sugar transport system permease protein
MASPDDAPRAESRNWQSAIGGRQLRRRWRLGSLLGKSVSYLVLIALAAMFLFPILWSLTASLKPLQDVYRFPPELWVSDPRWSNYPEAIKKLPFLLFMANTVVIVLAATTGQVFISSLVGYAFARLRFRGRDVLFIALLATMMLPNQVLLIPQFLIYKWLGWVNTYKPLIVPHWLGVGGGAFFIFLFRQFFKGIPQEMEEAARIDGAGDFQIYWRIFLPNAKPALVTVAVMSMIGHWKEFMGPLIYLSDFQKYPISMGLQMYNAMEGSWVNLLMAASVVALAPLVLLFLVAQRYFVKGMLLTGSKG